MANISITSECDRGCTYCFAAATAGGAATVPHMSAATFELALDFLERSGIDQARLLGGEPTLHPEFIRLAEMALRRGLRLLVFTHGDMPERTLRWLSETSPERVAVLVNATSVDAVPRRTLASLARRVTLGFTITSPLFDASPLLGLIREFNLSPGIRFGLAHPAAGGSNAFLGPDDYTEAGRRLAEFAEVARAAGVTLSFDCGFVPCMFPREFAAEAATGSHCAPILDILANGDVAACYPLAGLAREALPEYETADWLRRRFETRIGLRARPSIFSECTGCEHREAGRCAGGCMAAATAKAHVPAPAFERADPELPLFRRMLGRSSLLYTPGQLATVPMRTRAIPEELRRRAAEAQERRRRLAEAPFAPQCLTIYLNDRCNLSCGYCYALPGRRADSPRINEAAALGAAELVVRSCAKKGARFYLVLHGGGEPTLEWESVVRLTESTRAMAGRAGVGWFGFLATNGVIPEDKAAWLAREMDEVEISCDGPPDIQDRQRPLANGGRSSLFVERTARILREAGGRFVVRATVTPETVGRQTDIVSYLRGVLGATEMRFEPVYGLRRSKQPVFRPEHAGWFVGEFLRAQRRARDLHCDLTYAGARLDEIHGPYCDVLRNVLHLLPDGSATPCFFDTDGNETAERSRIGHFDAACGEYLLDWERIASHRKAAAELPPACVDCLTAYHCAGDCPERCRVTGAPGETPSFRCLIQKRLAEAWILEAARSL